MVIQELCQTFIHLRKPAQAMSIILRRVIWSWIESFEDEFITLSNAGRRLEGGAEVLFDVIYTTLAESSDKRKIYAWPALTSLLLLLPDVLEKLVVGEASRSAGLIKKVTQFSVFSTSN